MSNITRLDIPTRNDLDPDLILEANKGRFQGFILVGVTHEGQEECVSTYSDAATCVWLAEYFKRETFKNAFGE